MWEGKEFIMKCKKIKEHSDEDDSQLSVQFHSSTDLPGK
jgi:hypothetical protein